MLIDALDERLLAREISEDRGVGNSHRFGQLARLPFEAVFREEVGRCFYDLLLAFGRREMAPCALRIGMTAVFRVICDRLVIRH